MIPKNETKNNTYNLTINPSCYGKDTNTIGNDSWEAANLSITDMMQFSYVQGKAIAAGLFDHAAALIDDEKTHKNNRLWAGSELLIVDSDTGDFSLDMITQDDFLSKHLAAAYPSSSHCPDKSKYHLIFIPDTMIQDANHYKAIALDIMQKCPFTADKAMKTVSQAIFGTVFNQPSMRGHNKSLNDGLVYINEDAQAVTTQPIITAYEQEQAAILEQTRHDAPARIAPTGTRAETYAQAAYQSIIDELASATKGTRNTTLWATALKLYGRHKGGWPTFTESMITSDLRRIAMSLEQGDVIESIIERAAKKAQPIRLTLSDDKRNPYVKIDHQKEGKRPAFTPHDTVNMPYISDMDIKPYLGYSGLIIKSPLASGKTELLKRVIAEQKQLLGHEPRVLIVNFLQGLAKDTRKRFDGLGFEIYMDYGNEAMQYIPSLPRVICSLDSIHKLFAAAKPTPYDLVVLDEATQALSHFYGQTMGTKAALNYKVFSQIVKDARLTIALDAHMTDTITTWVNEHCGGQVCAIENSYTPNRGTLHLHTHWSSVVARALDDIATHDGPVIIPCSSKKDSETIHRLITDIYGNEGVMLVNSSTSHLQPQKALLANINDELRKLRALITTWSIGTGIDVQARVKGVYAIMRGNPLVPAEMLQMIMRYRNTSNRHVFVQSYHSKQSTEWRELHNKNMAKTYHTAKAAKFKDYGLVPSTLTEHEIAEYKARIEADRNTQKQDLIASFATLARHEGFNLSVIEGKHAAIAAAYSATKQTIQDEWKTLVLFSQPIDHDTYKMHQIQGTLTRDIEAGFLKWKIEDLTNLELTAPIFDVLDTKQKRDKLRRYCDFRSDLSTLQALDREQAAKGVLLSKRHNHTTIANLITSFIHSVFGKDLTLPKHELERGVIAFLNSNGDDFTNYFNEENRSGLSNNPIAVIRRILSRVGIRMTSEQKRLHGERVRVYAIDTTSDYYQLWVKLARSRLQKLKNEGVSKPVFTLNKHVLRHQTALDRIIHDLHEEKWIRHDENTIKEAV